MEKKIQELEKLLSIKEMKVKELSEDNRQVHQECEKLVEEVTFKDKIIEESEEKKTGAA